uniref:Uncharacterized protein n=1 Tax=uncultured myxobacterium HF0130_06F04 TaxID=723555 RepID=E7C2F9_9BACT|nr:hypothetical protein [uncultured myxobacterium HF0130_06F04]
MSHTTPERRTSFVSRTSLPAFLRLEKVAERRDISLDTLSGIPGCKSTALRQTRPSLQTGGRVYFNGVRKTRDLRGYD